LFFFSTSKKGISSYELARRLSLRQTTCYFFKRKVVKAMNIEDPKLLEGKVDVDAFFVGGTQTGKRGRSKGKKKEVVMGIEMKNKGTVRCYAKHINGAGSKELKPFFQKYISKQALVLNDKWRGYSPIENLFQWLKQEK
jgi:transposase-like protein